MILWPIVDGLWWRRGGLLLLLLLLPLKGLPHGLQPANVFHPDGNPARFGRPDHQGIVPQKHVEVGKVPLDVLLGSGGGSQQGR